MMPKMILPTATLVLAKLNLTDIQFNSPNVLSSAKNDKA